MAEKNTAACIIFECFAGQQHYATFLSTHTQRVGVVPPAPLPCTLENRQLDRTLIMIIKMR